MFGEDDVVREHKSRGDLIGAIIVICFLIIIARLWYLQIYRGNLLYQYSVENRLRKEVVKAPRGMVFSRNNQLLIHNIPRFDAVITPQYLQDKEESIQKLGKILRMKPEKIHRILQKHRGQASYQQVVIKKNISRKEVAIIETESSKIPGVSVDTFISREYVDDKVGAHLLGYISEISQSQLPRYRKRDNYNYRLGDFIGQAGIEEEFDLYLRGEDGFRFMEVDALGRMKRHVRSGDLFSGMESKPAKPGNNIRLTIDRDMQLKAYESLKDKVGATVAVDVNTGEILSMVSRPSFNPSKFSHGLTSKYWKKLSTNPANPMIDRTIQEHYSPGSTFKTFTAIAALEEDIVEKDEEVRCPGVFKLGRRTFHDWKRGGHGMTDVYKALRESVDVYFYKIGTKLDIDVLADYARRFGLGEKTGINLPREIPGLIPTKEWKRKRFGESWQLGETLSCVIGQSYVLTTPLQLALAYAGVANDGKLWRPYLIKEIFTNSGDIVENFEPQLVEDISVDQETLDAVQKGLYQVVNDQDGTAWWFRGRGIRMSGKTGTSQVKSMSKAELFSKCEEMPYENRHHGLFVGYAPSDNPQVAVATIVEHGCHGSTSAAPVVRDVLQTYMKKYHPELYASYYEEDKERDIRLWRERQRRKKEREQREQREREKREREQREKEEALQGESTQKEEG